MSVNYYYNFLKNIVLKHIFQHLGHLQWILKTPYFDSLYIPQPHEMSFLASLVLCVIAP